jgi:hypothetical protein
MLNKMPQSRSRKVVKRKTSRRSTRGSTRRSTRGSARRSTRGSARRSTRGSARRSTRGSARRSGARSGQKTDLQIVKDAVNKMKKITASLVSEKNFPERLIKKYGLRKYSDRETDANESLLLDNQLRAVAPAEYKKLMAAEWKKIAKSEKIEKDTIEKLRGRGLSEQDYHDLVARV